MEDKVQAVIYGDSLMRATVIDDTMHYHSTIGMWLARLSRFGIEFKNRAHFGVTIEKGKTLLQKDLQKGIDCDYAVVEYGGNDCSFAWEEVAACPCADHQPFTAPERFRDVCTEMVGTLQDAGIKPVLVTLPPLHAERHLEFIGKTEQGRSNILKWLGDTQRIYRFHEMYSGIIEKVAKQTGAILVDVRHRFLAKRNLGDLVGLDGVHLSPAGYRVYQQAFADFIKLYRKNPARLVYE